MIHSASPTRGAVVVRGTMNRHCPAVWTSDHFTAQQGNAARHQTCLDHLARDSAYPVEVRVDSVPLRLLLWPESAFARAERVTDPAASTLSVERQALERRLSDILSALSRCDLLRQLQAKIGRACDLLLVFLDHPETVEATNNGNERLPCPAVVRRTMTKGYRSTWAASGEADICAVVDTAPLAGVAPFATAPATLA